MCVFETHPTHYFVRLVFSRGWICVVQKVFYSVKIMTSKKYLIYYNKSTNPPPLFQSSSSRGDHRRSAEAPTAWYSSHSGFHFDVLSVLFSSLSKYASLHLQPSQCMGGSGACSPEKIFIKFSSLTCKSVHLLGHYTRKKKESEFALKLNQFWKRVLSFEWIIWKTKGWLGEVG
jgi:hypothetical protein